MEKLNYRTVKPLVGFRIKEVEIIRDLDSIKINSVRIYYERTDSTLGTLGISPPD